MLAVGESLTVPAGLAHRYYNSGDRPAAFRFVARPGLAYERSLRASFGREADGRSTRRGLPRNPLEAALVIEASDSLVIGVPLGLQQCLVNAAAGLARRLGTHRRLDPHLSPRPSRP